MSGDDCSEFFLVEIGVVTPSISIEGAQWTHFFSDRTGVGVLWVNVPCSQNVFMKPCITLKSVSIVGETGEDLVNSIRCFRRKESSKDGVINEPTKFEILLSAAIVTLLKIEVWESSK